MLLLASFLRHYGSKLIIFNLDRDKLYGHTDTSKTYTVERGMMNKVQKLIFHGSSSHIFRILLFLHG